jgi:hypothetical protein
MAKEFLTDLTLKEGLFIEERASALGDVAGYGQVWVKNDGPNTLYFTDDAGTDWLLNGNWISDITGETLSDLSDVPAEPTGGSANYFLQYADTGDTFSWVDVSTLGGASQLSDLSDVVSATNTNRFALMANGTTGYVGRALVEADISDLQSYALASHTHTLSDVTDVTATVSEVNLLDLSGLTTGWVLSADSATTASWQQILGSDISNTEGWTSNAGTVTSVAIAGTDGIEIVSGSPITTSGTITLGFEIDNIGTSLTSGLVSTDELVISDAGVTKKMDVSVLETYMQSNLTFGNMSSFTFQADSGTPQTINDGETIDITGGIGVATTVAGGTPNTATVDMDFSKLSTGTMTSTDYFIMQDVGASPEERRIQASAVKLSVLEDDLEYSATATIRNYDASDDIVIFTPNRNVTITEVIAAVSGGIGQSVTFNITHATTLTGTSPDLWTADQTVTSSTPATVSGTTSDNTVLADDAVRVKLSAAAGTGRQIFTVTVFYTPT